MAGIAGTALLCEDGPRRAAGVRPGDMLAHANSRRAAGGWLPVCALSGRGGRRRSGAGARSGGGGHDRVQTLSARRRSTRTPCFFCAFIVLPGVVRRFDTMVASYRSRPSVPTRRRRSGGAGLSLGDHETRSVACGPRRGVGGDNRPNRPAGGGSLAGRAAERRSATRRPALGRTAKPGARCYRPHRPDMGCSRRPDCARPDAKLGDGGVASHGERSAFDAIQHQRKRGGLCSRRRGFRVRMGGASRKSHGRHRRAHSLAAAEPPACAADRPAAPLDGCVARNLGHPRRDVALRRRRNRPPSDPRARTRRIPHIHGNAPLPRRAHRGALAASAQRQPADLA